MGVLLDCIYAGGLVLTSPVWLYKMLRHGRYRDDIGQRLGAVPVRYGLQPTIWIHGVSLGEVNAARTLVEEIHRQLPDFRVVLSTSTETGMAQARKLYAPDHVVFRWPLDFTLAVRRALRRMRPALVVMMEGEVWPNLLNACRRRGIPTAIVNGRISPDKGYPRYKKLGPLARWLFNRLSAIGCQSEQYAHLYRQLGVDAHKIHVTGMVKFDTAPQPGPVAGQDALAAAMGIGPDDRLIVAGGTGPGEEAILLEVFARLASRHRDARLAIVPRKPERFDEVARLIRDAGHELARRSEQPDGGAPPPGRPVLLGDTMGELRAFYALAHACFVGRSLVEMGGSDMIEAAALGKPVCFGPHTYNFPQADDLARNGCVRVADADALHATLDAWLTDPASAARAGDQASQYVAAQRGATRRNVEMLCELLGRVPAHSPRTIATDAPSDSR